MITYCSHFSLWRTPKLFIDTSKAFWAKSMITPRWHSIRSGSLSTSCKKTQWEAQLILKTQSESLFLSCFSFLISYCTENAYICLISFLLLCHGIYDDLAFLLSLCQWNALHSWGAARHGAQLFLFTGSGLCRSVCWREMLHHYDILEYVTHILIFFPPHILSNSQNNQSKMQWSLSQPFSTRQSAGQSCRLHRWQV